MRKEFIKCARTLRFTDNKGKRASSGTALSPLLLLLAQGRKTPPGLFEYLKSLLRGALSLAYIYTRDTRACRRSSCAFSRARLPGYELKLMRAFRRLQVDTRVLLGVNFGWLGGW